MVKLRSIMLESRVHAPFGKDYDFKCTCITGSTKFPKFSITSEYLSGDGSTPIPIISAGKSHLGVVSRINQFKSTLDKSPHYVLKSQDGLRVTKGSQLRRSLENSKPNMSTHVDMIYFQDPSIECGHITCAKTEEYSWLGTMIIPLSYLKFLSSLGVGLISPLTLEERRKKKEENICIRISIFYFFFILSKL